MFSRTYSIIALVAILATYSLTVAQGEAELSLKTDQATFEQGQEFDVDIELKNPEGQAIISVRSWLEYDNQSLEALSIDTQNTPFNLAAPGEDEVSQSEGRVKIGRSNISGGASQTETKVATVKFRVLSAFKANTQIKFYDYQVSELGHTSVNIIDGGFPLNILAQEPKSLDLTINANGVPATNGAVNPTNNTTSPDSTINPVEVSIPEIGGQASNQNIPVVLVRPTDLKVNTGIGYVDLQWNSEADVNRIGYNIYYGKTSGQYTRRRTIGSVDSYRLDGLNTGETYYFAITAYDINNTESDYSNEVGVIVGQPLSSTHPFAGILQSNYQQIPSQPQNGPLVGWLAFTATGLGASMVYRKKS